MTWASAEHSWCAFLDEVRGARRNLHCSNSGAWFRGVTDAKYAVIPSLHRCKLRIDPDFEKQKRRSETEIASFGSRYSDTKKEWQAAVASRSRDEEPSEKEKSWRKKLQDLRKANDDAKDLLGQIALVPSGERDAYVEWCFRSGKQNEPSWLVLAEMQHCGLPTRLLDWSESLLVSIFFATKKFRVAVESRCRMDSAALETMNGDPALLGPEVMSSGTSPAIWILNPYAASERATGRTRIWDLSRDHYDYYEAFVHLRKWPFDKAVPAFSPWSSGRIAAQQGLFTVWGHDRRPLDEQLGRGCLTKVNLPPMAALYAVRHMRELGGMDHFSMYRDLDSLAAGLKQKFFDQ